MKKKLISRRVARTDASGIRKAFAMAQRLASPINFSIGQPHFAPPARFVEALAESARGGAHRYTPTEGLPELREALAERLRREKGLVFEDLMVTAGVAGGLALALGVLVEEGDEVIISDPYFLMYKQLVLFYGGTPVFLSTYPDFRLRPERMEGLITARTKLIILNSPNNPTGLSIGEDEVRAVAEIARRRGVTVISDEIYEEFSFDVPHASVARFNDRTVYLHGFSKAYAIPGLRLGYAAGPAEILSEMAKLQQFTFVCAPSIVQQAALKVLEHDLSAEVEAYRRKRDRIYDGLKDLYDVRRPEGAFYIFPRAPGGKGEGFCERALQKNLILVPGSVFSERDTHFRISYACDDETLDRGLAALRELAG